jgi:hypothetical protein
MEKVINSDSTVTQMWRPVTPKNQDYVEDVISETSVLTIVTSYEIPADVYHQERTTSNFFEFLEISLEIFIFGPPFGGFEGYYALDEDGGLHKSSIA